MAEARAITQAGGNPYKAFRRRDETERRARENTRRGEGSAASSLQTTAHPLYLVAMVWAVRFIHVIYTRFTKRFGASVCDTTKQPNPRLSAAQRLAEVEMGLGRTAGSERATLSL